MDWYWDSLFGLYKTGQYGEWQLEPNRGGVGGYSLFYYGQYVGAVNGDGDVDALTEAEALISRHLEIAP